MQYGILKLKTSTVKPQIVEVNSNSLELDTLYNEIDCDTIQFIEPLLFNSYMEAIGEKHDYLLCIDDNGKVFQKEINPVASIMYQPLYDFIVGNAILGRRERSNIEDPDFYSLNLDEVIEVYEHLRDFLRKRYDI